MVKHMKNKAKLIVVISYAIGIISGIIISSGLVYAVSLFNATKVEYDTTNSGTTNSLQLMNYMIYLKRIVQMDMYAKGFLILKIQNRLEVIHGLQ